MAELKHLSLLRQQVRLSRVVNHEFFNIIQGPEERAKALITRFLQLDSIVASEFSQVLAAIIAGCSDRQARFILTENLWDEQGQGDPSRVHAVLFDEMLYSMQIDVPRSIDSSAARSFLDYHYELASKSTFLAAAAFCYANELLCLLEFPPIEGRCKDLFSDFDGRYFRENALVDSDHARRLEECMLQLASSDGQWDEAAEVVALALELRASVYDEAVSAAG